MCVVTSVIVKRVGLRRHDVGRTSAKLQKPPDPTYHFGAIYSEGIRCSFKATPNTYSYRLVRNPTFEIPSGSTIAAFEISSLSPSPRRNDSLCRSTSRWVGCTGPELEMQDFRVKASGFKAMSFHRDDTPRHEAKHQKASIITAPVRVARATTRRQE